MCAKGVRPETVCMRHVMEVIMRDSLVLVRKLMVCFITAFSLQTIDGGSNPQSPARAGIEAVHSIHSRPLLHHRPFFIEPGHSIYGQCYWRCANDIHLCWIEKKTRMALVASLTLLTSSLARLHLLRCWWLAMDSTNLELERQWINWIQWGTGIFHKKYLRFETVPAH